MMTVTQEEGVPLSRPMSFMETFHVSAANVGRPATLAMLATLPTSAQHSITEPNLLAAIDRLLSLYPILKCAVVGGRTKMPSFQVQVNLDARRVLEVRTELPPDEETLLSELVNLGNSFDGTRGPLWRVVWYAGPKPRIGLSIAHVLTDGGGVRDLFCDLLKLLRKSNDADLPAPGTIASTWDSTEDLKLRWPAIVLLLWTLLLSKIWSLFHSVERIVPAKGPFGMSPTKCAIVRLSPQQLNALKSYVKQTGIKTLHPLLKGAVLTSAFLARRTPLKRGLIGVSTPIAFRSAALGHPRTGGNYASAFWKEMIIEGNQPFVELCRSYGAELALPRTKRIAKEKVNILQLLPAPTAASQTNFQLDGKAYPLIHGLEKFFLDIASGAIPPMFDIGTSNRMRMARCGWEDDRGEFKLSAAQNATVANAPLAVVVVSDSRGEMSLAVSWQETALEEGEYPRRFVELLRGVLEWVAEGEVGEGATISSFGAAV